MAASNARQLVALGYFKNAFCAVVRVFLAFVMVYFRLVDAGAILRRCSYCKAIPYVVNTYFLGVFP